MQLAVPKVAALGGVVLLGERLTARLMVASIAVIGGIALVMAGRHALSAPARAPLADSGRLSAHEQWMHGGGI